MNIMSDSVSELFTALSKAQGEMRLVPANRKNPFFKSEYTDMGGLVSASREILSKHGLAVCQTTYINEVGTLILITTLTHSSGQWIKGELPIFAEKQTPQGFGSALTYFRRYAYSAITGCIAGDEDDDANEGEAQVVKNQVSQQATSKPQGYFKTVLTATQKAKVLEIQKEFPKLVQNAINSLGKDKTVDDLDDNLYREIIRREAILRGDKIAGIKEQEEIQREFLV